MVTTNRTLLRGLDILRVFNDLRDPTVTSIAEATWLPKSTTSRFLAVLVDEGYLRLNDQQRFSLAPRVLELGFSALRGLGISEMVAGPLQDIADFCEGAANIGELDGADVIIIARRTWRGQRERFYSMNIHIGTRLPALFTATGRALLSLDPNALETALKMYRKSRNSPPFDEAKVRRTMDAVRRSGVAGAKDELAPGFGAAAVPLRLGSGRKVALSGSYLTADHQAEFREKLENLLKADAPRMAGLIAGANEFPGPR